MGWLDEYEKAQDGKKSYKEAPPEMAKDVIPTFTPKPLTFLTPEQRAEREKQHVIEQTGGLKSYEPQSFLSKAFDVMADPFTAAELYTKQGYVPDNFREAVRTGVIKSNPYEIAGDFINPVDAARFVVDAPESFKQGNYVQGGLELLSALPLAGEATQAVKKNKQFFVKNTPEEVIEAVRTSPIKESARQEAREEIARNIRKHEDDITHYDRDIAWERRWLESNIEGGLPSRPLESDDAQQFFRLIDRRRNIKNTVKDLEADLNNIDEYVKKDVLYKMAHDNRYASQVRQKLLGKHYTDYFTPLKQQYNVFKQTSGFPDVIEHITRANEQGKLLSPKYHLYNTQKHIDGDSWSHFIKTNDKREAIRYMSNTYSDIPAGGQFRERSLSSDSFPWVMAKGRQEANKKLIDVIAPGGYNPLNYMGHKGGAMGYGQYSSNPEVAKQLAANLQEQVTKLEKTIGKPIPPVKTIGSQVYVPDIIYQKKGQSFRQLMDRNENLLKTGAYTVGTPTAIGSNVYLYNKLKNKQQEEEPVEKKKHGGVVEVDRGQEIHHESNWLDDYIDEIPKAQDGRKEVKPVSDPNEIKRMTDAWRAENRPEEWNEIMYKRSSEQAKKETAKEWVKQSMEDVQDHPLYTLPGMLSPLAIEDLALTGALKGFKYLKQTPVGKQATNKVIDWATDINWGKWNKEIPGNEKLMREYVDIERNTKADGSWMKNPDGSEFKGTPEQFVQQRSKNFKKAFGNTDFVYNTDVPVEFFHGTKRDIFPEILKSPKQQGDSFMGTSATNKNTEHVFFTPDKESALGVARGDGKKVKGFYINANEPKIIRDNYSDIASPKLNHKKDILTNTYFGRNKYNPLKSRLENSEFVTDASLQFRGEKYSEIAVPTEKIFPKASVGNNGMFDMSNPNIYKSIFPLILGSAAAGRSGETKKYQDGGDVEPGKKEGDNPLAEWWYNADDVRNAYTRGDQVDNSWYYNWLKHPETIKRIYSGDQHDFNVKYLPETAKKNIDDAHYQTDDALGRLENLPYYHNQVNMRDAAYNSKVQGFNPPRHGLFSLRPQAMAHYQGISHAAYDPTGKSHVAAHELAHATGKYAEAREMDIGRLTKYKSLHADDIVNYLYGTGYKGGYDAEAVEKIKKESPKAYESYEDDAKYYNKDGWYPRIMDIRRRMKVEPGQIIDDKMIDKFKTHSPYRELKYNFTDEEILKILNTVADNTKMNTNSGYAKHGKVIEDNRGQWAHPGEVTKINSNNITMEGVNYPVLGVSNTGDTQLMQPGGNYHFKGENVTEFPIKAQDGSTVELDEVEVVGKRKSTTPEYKAYLEKVKKYKDSLNAYDTQNTLNAQYLSQFKEVPKPEGNTDFNLFKYLKQTTETLSDSDKRNKLASQAKETAIQMYDDAKNNEIADKRIVTPYDLENKYGDNERYENWRHNRNILHAGKPTKNSEANIWTPADAIFNDDTYDAPQQYHTSKKGNIETVIPYKQVEDRGGLVGKIFNKKSGIIENQGYPMQRYVDENIQPIGTHPFYQSVAYRSAPETKDDSSIGYDANYMMEVNLPYYKKPTEVPPFQGEKYGEYQPDRTPTTPLRGETLGIKELASEESDGLTEKPKYAKTPIGYDILKTHQNPGEEFVNYTGFTTFNPKVAESWAEMHGNTREDTGPFTIKPIYDKDNFDEENSLLKQARRRQVEKREKKKKPKADGGGWLDKYN